MVESVKSEQVAESIEEKARENYNQQMNAMQKLVEKQMIEEEQANLKFKKRMFLLIPYNTLMVYLTLKYMQNYSYIAKKLWPNVRKATLGNLLYLGTIQAFAMTTFYLGGNMAILGVNPRAIYLRHKQQEEEMAALYSQSGVLDGSSMSGALKEAEIFFAEDPTKKVQDVFVMQMFKSMGLSDKTIMVIEADLRE